MNEEYEKLDLAIKLPAEDKQKWLEALRSGKYTQQNKGYLKTINNEYCCLGVYADIAALPLTEESGDAYAYGYRTNPNSIFPFNFGWITEHSSLKPEVKAVLEQSTGFFSPSTVEKLLGHFNDRDETFETIANWIEDNL